MIEHTEEQKLNPKVMDLEIGIRNLRTIKIFPLSFGDQLRMTDVIAQGISEFFNTEEKTDIALISFGMTKIKAHLLEILSYILDEGEDAGQVMNEMDNEQVMKCVELIYIMNFESQIKNAKSLFEKVKNNLSLSERPLPQSVKDMDTNSEISIKNGSEMEATPEDS